MQHNGVVQLLRSIIVGTVIIELGGAVLLSISFIPKMGAAAGIWSAVFHSVSAFCNAGFDLMGRYGSFSSFTSEGLCGSPLVLLTLSALIVIGGLGFLVRSDMKAKRFRFKQFEVHTKIVLTVSAALIVLGTVLFLVFENSNALAGMSFGKKLLASLFQSVSPRTAGMNSVSLSSLTSSAYVLMMLLMLIGGSPGSTAGGIKTTTFFVLLLSAWSSARRYGGMNVFKHRLEKETVAQASSIATVYIFAIIIASLIIGALEPRLSLTQVLFETISAVATVGLTTGITAGLCAGSKIVLMVLMFAGRIGGLTFMLVLAERRVNVPLERPTAKILIG